jgi:peptide/nickel transport system permease protein
MLSYLLQRVVQALVALLGIAVIIFFLLHLDTASPARAELGLRASQKAVNALNKALGLDEPVPVQFWHWFQATFVSGQLFQLMDVMLPRTLELAGLGIGLAFLAAIWLASWQMRHADTLGDRVLTAVLYVLNSTPAFWLSLILIWEFALNLLWLPPDGVAAVNHQGLWEWLFHMLMPVAAVFAAAVGGWTRFLRAALEETLETDFVRTARAKGADEAQVLRRHSLRNSLLPLLTLAGSSFPVLINTVIVVEVIFFIPGAGAGFYQSLTSLNFTVATSLAFLLALVGVLGSLLADLTYVWADPRIQYR